MATVVTLSSVIQGFLWLRIYVKKEQEEQYRNKKVF